MTIRTIVFDLDDTLLRDDLTLSEKTLSVLRRAAAAGIRIIPASGRARESMRGFVEQLGCASCYISCNGAEIWSPESTLLSQEMFPVPLAREIARFAAEKDCYAQTYAGDQFFYNSEGFYAEAYASATMLKGVYVGNLEAFITQPTPKILLMDEDERVARLLTEARSRFDGRASITCSKSWFLEFNPLRATKGNALRWCAEHFGFSLEETIAFGDSLNDVSMLTAAGRGIAMGNARDDVKAMGFETCGTNMQDGVACYIEEHVLGGAQ